MAHGSKEAEVGMNQRLPLYVTCFFLANFVCSASAYQSETEAKDPQRVLRAMDNTPAEGHPDEYNEFAGMRAYFAGRYPEAMKSFLEAARYADKLSQLSIGLMYLNGQGVQKDPVTAFAWVAIAAERKYPQFLVTRNEIWSRLDAQQRDKAKALVEKLYAEYGDMTAKPRMAMVLRRERTHQTGSYLGFGSDSVASLTPTQFFGVGGGIGGYPKCGSETIDGATMTGCGNIYTSWRWDPKQYFAVRDGAWTGTVTVGTLQNGQTPSPPDKRSDKQKDIQ
ncbi:sel1 repeat family protein [Rhodanobacter sp. L36]|uniref:tetratricopeptide repeat protein n=1 Tax=Rhodanobacter sp. L36 TaxID=1747221 RepID=UPI00131E0655|nr:sel1 repeat family protein [Rhodanobacter sp. L36]